MIDFNDIKGQASNMSYFSLKVNNTGVISHSMPTYSNN